MWAGKRTFERLVFQLEGAFFIEGLDDTEKGVGVFVDAPAEPVHRPAGGFVKSHPVPIPIGKDLEEISGRILPVLSWALKYNPHITPERRFVLGEARIPVNTGDGLVHGWCDFEIWIDAQHKTSQVGDEVLQRLQDIVLIHLAMGVEPDLVVVFGQTLQKLQGLRRKSNKCL
jgi:hypothetical protein